MKIYYEQIKDEGLELQTSFSFNEEEDYFDVKSFKGRVGKAGDAYVLTGRMEAGFSCPCDRCLEKAEKSFHEDISVSLSPLGFYPEPSLEEESGLTDEEAGMYVTEKDYFDLHELLREEALLLVPIKRLCREDCKGICEGCGALLNSENCRCEAPINPKMAALEKLKKKD